MKIVQGYVWPKLIREYQLDSRDKFHHPEHEIFICTQGLELADDAAQALIQMCTEEGIRDLERTYRALCEAVIGIYYAQGILYKRIDTESLPTLLGPVFYQKSRNRKAPPY